MNKSNLIKEIEYYHLIPSSYSPKLIKTNPFKFNELVFSGFNLTDIFKLEIL